MTTEEEKRRYPRRVLLGDREIEFRYLTAEDRGALLDFAGDLSEHDLLFLRRDITQPAVVDTWLGEIAAGFLISIVAIDGGAIAGYATLDRSRLRWSAHVAEIRVVVSQRARGLGLGRRLTQEAFSQAVASGIEKVVARMTLDQKAAISVFESLGFRPEGLLKDHVRDRAGDKHDLVVMSHDVADFEQSLVSYGVTEALAGA